MDFEKENWLPNRKNSKYLPITLVIIFLVPILIGGYFAVKKAKKMNRSQQRNPKVVINTIDKKGNKEPIVNEINSDVVVSTPDQVTQSFYNWYLAAPDQEKENYALRSEVTKNFSEEAKKATDPFGQPAKYGPLCNSKLPSRIEINIDKLRSSNAHLTINAHYTSIVPIQIKLIKEKEQWKINELKCLHNSTRSFIENTKKLTELEDLETIEDDFIWRKKSGDKSRYSERVSAVGFKYTGKDSSEISEALYKKIGAKDSLYNEGGITIDDLNLVCLQKKAPSSFELLCGKLN